MWRNIHLLTDLEMRHFEEHFAFTVTPPLRQFLIDHNGGYPSSGSFPTVVRERKLEYLLNFADPSSRGAMEINRRLRKHLGPKMIVIGCDDLGNYVCVQRDYKQQNIVLWNHVTNMYEPCLWDIPTFLRNIC